MIKKATAEALLELCGKGPHAKKGVDNAGKEKIEFRNWIRNGKFYSLCNPFGSTTGILARTLKRRDIQNLSSTLRKLPFIKSHKELTTTRNGKKLEHWVISLSDDMLDFSAIYDCMKEHGFTQEFFKSWYFAKVFPKVIGSKLWKSFGDQYSLDQVFSMKSERLLSGSGKEYLFSPQLLFPVKNFKRYKEQLNRFEVVQRHKLDEMLLKKEIQLHEIFHINWYQNQFEFVLWDYVITESLVAFFLECPENELRLLFNKFLKEESYATAAKYLSSQEGMKIFSNQLKFFLKYHIDRTSNQDSWRDKDQGRWKYNGTLKQREIALYSRYPEKVYFELEGFYTNLQFQAQTIIEQGSVMRKYKEAKKTMA